MCLHWSWVLGISKGMIIENYQFSYGQVWYWFFFVVVPPFTIIFLVDYVSFFNCPTLDVNRQARSSSPETSARVSQGSSQLVQRGRSISPHRIAKPLARA